MASYQILNGKRYRIRRVSNLGPYLGHCDPPDSKDKEIRIQSGLPTKEEFDVLVHEILHACTFDMSEEWINNTAESITKVMFGEFIIEKKPKRKRNGTDRRSGD